MATLGLTIFFAVIVAFSALVGLVRGLNKAVIRIMTLVLAIILTFVVAGPVTSAVAQNLRIEGQTIGQLILEGVRSTDMMAAILDAAPLLQEAILVAPAFVMGIVLFPVVFMLLSFVSWIVFLCVQKPLRRTIFHDSCSKEEAAMQPMGVRVGKRFAGMGVGILTGALIFGMITAPMLGLFTILPEKKALDEALDAMVAQKILSAADAEAIESAYAVTDAPLANIYGAVGVSAAGRAYLNAISRIEADGHKTSLTNEFDSLLATVQYATQSGLASALLSPEDPSALYAFLADEAAMDALLQYMFSSQLLRSAVPEVMAFAMESVANGMNVPANKEAVYSNMMEKIAQAVQNADIDFAAIAAYEQANNHSRSGKSEDPELTQEDYEALIQKLVELATTISSILNEAIAGDHRAFTDSIADYIVMTVKTQASENGQDSLASFDAASVQAAISGIDAEAVDAGEGDAAELLEQLTDPEKFETDTATIESITASIRESIKNAVADDSTAAQTASTLASVVSDFADAVSSATDENGNLDASRLDFEKIANAVTTLQNSTLKDVGASVLDIVAAGDLGSNSLVSDALGAVKEGYENGEDIGGTISTAGALISLGSAMNGGEYGAANQEAMVDSLTSLINNLNDFTIGLLPSIISADTLESMGIPAEYASAAYGVVETLLKELMELKGAADYDNEVNAILALYNLAATGVEDFTEDDISKLVNCAMDSDAIFNTLVSISTSNPFGIEIPDETVRADLAKAIEDNYAQSGKTQREYDIYNAVANLLGLDEDVDLD